MNEAFMCGVRWASNILVELGNNYGSKLTEQQRSHLRVAISALADLDMAMRRGL
jgi:hypothetical protein